MEPKLAHRGAHDDLSTYLHRQCIGYLGMLLPLLVWWIAGRRPTEGIAHPWRLLDSVSAYYHTGGVIAFVGILAALAVFLLTYQGYDNADHRKDRVAAVVAGVAATLVASFPTAVPEGVRAPSWWTQQIGLIHNVSAVVLFGSFIFFSLFLFTKSGTTRPSKDKRRRNAVYVVCGVAMAVCMTWAAIASLRHGSIFVPEALALEFFAFSWLTKGRAGRTAKELASKTLRVARNPRQLVETMERRNRRAA